jgi:hypothetical protein
MGPDQHGKPDMTRTVDGNGPVLRASPRTSSGEPIGHLAAVAHRGGSIDVEERRAGSLAMWSANFQRPSLRSSRYARAF